MINQYLLGHKNEVTDGKKIWYVAELSGFVMEVDLFSKELKCLWKIPNSAGLCSYRSLFYYGHKLYVLPYYQGVIYVYDLYTNIYEKIEVKKQLELMGGTKRDKFLYIFGNKAEILKYNLEDKTITYIDVMLESFDLEDICRYWFWTKAFVMDGCIYIPVSNSNIIVVLDRHDKISFLQLGDKSEKWILENIQADSSGYKVIYCKGAVDKVRTYVSEYDLNGVLIEKRSIEEKYSYKVYPFVNAVWNENKWICLPFGRNKVLLRDKKHDEILFEINSGTKYLNDLIQGLFFCSVWIDDHILCAIDQSRGSLIYINVNNFEVNYSCLEFKENLQGLAGVTYQDAMHFQVVLKEDKGLINLKKVINYVCNKENNHVDWKSQTKDDFQRKDVIYAKGNTIWSRTRW